jgi:hypothetical protein
MEGKKGKVMQRSEACSVRYREPSGAFALFAM